MALCIFRASDFDSQLKEAGLAVQVKNDAIKKLPAANHTALRSTSESVRFMRINTSSEHLNSFQVGDILCF